MALTWLATEILTGIVIADLPDADVQSVKVTIGQYESTTGTLPLPFAPPNWERATRPGATVWNLVDVQDDGSMVPLWGGMVNGRTRDDGDVVQVKLATPEAYFDRRYVGDITYTQAGQLDIVADLIVKYVQGGSNGGIPLDFYRYPGGNTLRDRVYADDDDKTVYSVLQELSGVDGGPEWSVGWKALHGPERVVPVLYIGSRLGRPVTKGLGPNAVFDLPGNAVTAELDEDYTSDTGANDVMATSTASEDVRPESKHVVTPDPDRPTYEYRFTPSTSITDVATLNAHASATAVNLFDGFSTAALTANYDTAPKLNTEWFLGDDIGFELDIPGSSGAGVQVARAIGWEIDFGGTTTITPVLQPPGGVV